MMDINEIATCPGKLTGCRWTIAILIILCIAILVCLVIIPLVGNSVAYRAGIKKGWDGLTKGKKDIEDVGQNT